MEASARLSDLSWPNRLTYDHNFQILIERGQQRVKKSHYQSKRFVCVLNNGSYVVDRLLILSTVIYFSSVYICDDYISLA